MVTGKYCKRIPRNVLSVCVSVTSNRESDDQSSNIVFYNEDKKAVGAVYLQYESFKLVNGVPSFSIFIDSFEVCYNEQGKGYGPQMLKWIEENLPIHRIELCHMEFSSDNKRSYKFWKSQGFRKPNKNYQTLVKRIK